MEINKIYNCNFLENKLPDKSANLIIADPPYYNVKGDFDFIWKSFDEYLKDVEKWAIECKRILSDNGTLLWYGDSKNIAYSQIIFDKYFNLLSNVTCHIYDRQTNKIPANEARSFINTTERVLMYDNHRGFDALEYRIEHKMFLKRIELMKPIIDYMNEARNNANITISEINNLTNTKMGSIWFTHPSQWQLPTEKWYNVLSDIIGVDKLNIPYKDLKIKYDDINIIYESLKRPFKPTEKYKMDVLRVSQEGHITRDYDHDTVKPEKLTRILITTCSNENDLVIVPFSGSGTECAMSALENRNFIGFDIEKKYVDMGTKRVKKILDNPKLF